MDMTAFRLTPVRPELLKDTVRPEPVEGSPVFKPRRFSDPVSQLNCDVYDRARLLAAAVEMVDGLGLKIIAVEADATRNNRIQVEHSPECAALGGVEIHRQPGWSIWAAHRFGTEIRWVVQCEEAA